MDIINSEGTIIAIERIKNSHFLKIKKQNDNQYAYFPIDRTQLEKYFSGEITTRELLIPLDELSFIDDLYTDINNGLKRNSTTEILNKFNL
ncbi:MAG: hypothetical protein WCJ62_05190 [Flavobacterium sp.]